MTSQNLDNLARIGELKEEPFNLAEFDGLVKSARTRLSDAQVEAISLESRFDLAYGASHALALAALRRMGYRSTNRYLVFQCLKTTLGVDPGQLQLLALCHQRRNVAEYEGHSQVEERLVSDLIEVTSTLLELVAGKRVAG